MLAANLYSSVDKVLAVSTPSHHKICNLQTRSLTVSLSCAAVIVQA